MKFKYLNDIYRNDFIYALLAYIVSGGQKRPLRGYLPTIMPEASLLAGFLKAQAGLLLKHLKLL